MSVDGVCPTMDLETENRIASILMKEAAELRRQAEQEGVLSYLRQPTIRGRPNSRFLTATVLGVQQANKAVEVNELWRVRQKERELDDRLKARSRDASRNDGTRYRDTVSTSRNVGKRLSVNDDTGGPSCSSSKVINENLEADTDEEGLKDEEIEEFLHARAKRGRGSVGSRMDEAGPYLLSREDAEEKSSSHPDSWAQRAVYGVEMPFSLKSCKSAEEEARENRLKKAKKDNTESSKKKHSSHKHRSKEKSRDRKKEKKSRDRRKTKDGKRHRD